MNRETFARSLAIVAIACAAASAQPAALSQLRSAAGPDAVVAAKEWAASASPAGVEIRIGVPRFDDGHEDAARLCGRLPFDSDKNDCLAQVSRAGYVERAAAGVCSAMSFTSDIRPCLEAISDKAYLNAEIDACSRESFDDGKISCLRSAGRPAWGPQPGGAGREEAAAACGRAAFDSDRRDCVQVVSRSYFFDRGAIGVCSALSFSSSYPACFRAIADKEYLQEVVNVCARESFDDGKISCLQSSGAPWRNWPGPRWPPFPRRPWPPR